MKYFRLNFFCIYLDGFCGGCIYNTNTGDMIRVKKDNNDVLKTAQANEPVESDNEFLQELVSEGLGAFYDNPVYVECTRVGGDARIQNMMEPKTLVHKLFVQVTNDCGGGCVWCDNSDRIITKTRCKKWNNEERIITSEKWYGLLGELKNLGLAVICFIGGDPLMNLSGMEKIIIEAKKRGVERFVVYTNLGHLTPEEKDFINKYDIIVNLEVVNGPDSVGEYTNVVYKDVLANATILKKNNRVVIGNILMSRYNEKELDRIISDLKAVNVDKIKVDYIYEKPDNDYYSSVYREEMYKKRFAKITAATLGIYEIYNSCLYGQVSINLSGDVTPCPMMNNCVVGNILESDIVEILRSKEYRKFVLMSKSKINKCKDCGFRFNCDDCRAIEYSATNDVEGQYYCNYLEQQVDC